MLDDKDYFLSAINPVANVDQRNHEKQALRIYGRDDVQTACGVAREIWLRATDELYPADQMARFEEHITSWCFRGVMVATNTDANFPRIVRVYTRAAEWFGHKVPPSTWGGDNPNNAYRIVAVNHEGRYELRGQRQDNASTYVTYQLVGNTTTSKTMGSLEQHDIDINDDGSYVITLDSSPADGRRNHMTIPPGTLFLFIRDSMGDWQEMPDALRIKRLNEPTRAPLDDDELAARAVESIINDSFYGYYASRLFFNAPQMMRQPEAAGAVGGLVTQWGSLGHFTIAEDEAVIITANHGGAEYRDIVLHDFWLRALDYRNAQNSLVNAQIKPDADGRTTFVVSIADPGIHNWLDTGGLHDVLILRRWQGVVEKGAEKPAIESRKVKLSELASSLPAGVATVTAEERQAQLKKRQEEYDRRYHVDGNR